MLLNGKLQVLCLIQVNILILFGSKASCQKFTLGYCPSIEPMADIYLRRYMGTWYQFASLSNIWKVFRKCVKYNYTLGENGGFYITSSYKTAGKDKEIVHFGMVSPTEYTGLPQEADFEVHYYNWLRNTSGWSTQLYVLNTDYESYAVEYSCTEIMYSKLQRLRVLVRDIKVEYALIMEKVRKTLETEEIDSLLKYLRTTNQNARGCGV